MNAKTNLGPCLARDTLFFTGHIKDKIGEAIYTGEGDDPWDVRGWIGDIGNGRRSYTACEPSAIKHLGMWGTDDVGLYHLVHLGRPFYDDRIIDNKIWYRTRRIDWDHWGPKNSIPGAYSTHAPSIAEVSTWFQRAQRSRIMVAYRCINDRIALKTYTGDFLRSDWYTTYLPDEARTSIGPTLVTQIPSGGAEPQVLYRATRGNRGINYAYAMRDASLGQLSWEWNIERIPNAHTNQTPGAARTSPSRLVVAFTGHNNNFIEIRVRESGSWQNLGYVRGLATEERPALSFEHRLEGRTEVETLFLAFKPINHNEICVGLLELDEDIGPDTPGHRWTSIRRDRPELNCGSS